MSDTPPQAPPPAPPQPPPSAPPGDEPPAPVPAGPGGTFTQDQVDAMIGTRLQRERSKYGDYEEAKRKAAEFDQIQDANKTELQKATDAGAADKARADAAESQLARFEIAVAKGLDPALAPRLQGATKAELEADADALIAQFGAAPPGGQPTTPPPGAGVVQNLRPAGAGQELPEETDPRKLAELHPRR